MRLESSELRAFHAVVTQGSFKNAADYLHLSQSAISQAVAGLEHKLQTRLIQRGKKATLTQTGRRLFDYAAQNLHEEQTAIEDIAQLRQSDVETLSISTNGMITRSHAPHIVAGFCKKFGAVNLHIKELPSRQIIHSVLAGTTDIGIGPFQKQMDALEKHSLHQEQRILVVGEKHPDIGQLLNGHSKALLKTPLITSFLDDANIRPSIERIRDKFAAIWQVSSLELRIQLVAEGLGVAYLDNHLLDHAGTNSGLRPISNISFGSIDRHVGIYFKSGKQLNPAANAFIEFCKKHWQTA